MANILVFPDQGSFEAGFEALGTCAIQCETLATPAFCRGLVAPAVVTVGNINNVTEVLSQRGVTISGVFPFYPFKKAVPEAAPPDSRWTEVIGGLRVVSVKPSVTDPLRLRVEMHPARPLDDLIPVMARLIRGGAYHPAIPVLAFEEEHRLLCFSPGSIVVSRVDDLRDIWIMVRTLVDFICMAWGRRHSLKPETQPRQGIGAIEIFKHLPATNCGKCGASTCMEFATGLLTGRSRVEWCQPLNEEAGSRRRESLLWLLRAIGLESALGGRSATGSGRSMDEASIPGE